MNKKIIINIMIIVAVFAVVILFFLGTHDLIKLPPPFDWIK
jgi:hypothetical protein